MLAFYSAWFHDFKDAGGSTVGLKPLGDRFLECFEEGPLEVQWSEQIFRMDC